VIDGAIRIVLRHVDREGRTARQHPPAAGSPPPPRPRRSRSQVRVERRRRTSRGIRRRRRRDSARRGRLQRARSSSSTRADRGHAHAICSGSVQPARTAAPADHGYRRGSELPHAPLRASAEFLICRDLRAAGYVWPSIASGAASW
jgi:hypothetical protein